MFEIFEHTSRINHKDDRERSYKRSRFGVFRSKSRRSAFETRGPRWVRGEPTSRCPIKSPWNGLHRSSSLKTRDFANTFGEGGCRPCPPHLLDHLPRSRRSSSCLPWRLWSRPNKTPLRKKKTQGWRDSTGEWGGRLGGWRAGEGTWPTAQPVKADWRCKWNFQIADETNKNNKGSTKTRANRGVLGYFDEKSVRTIKAQKTLFGGCYYWLQLGHQKDCSESFVGGVFFRSLFFGLIPMHIFSRGVHSGQKSIFALLYWCWPEHDPQPTWRCLGGKAPIKSEFPRQKLPGWKSGAKITVTAFERELAMPWNGRNKNEPYNWRIFSKKSPKKIWRCLGCGWPWLLCPSEESRKVGVCQNITLVRFLKPLNSDVFTLELYVGL